MKMSKLLALCLALVLLLASCTSSKQPDSDGLSFTPGTYEGSAQGYGGTITLGITVDETKIVSVEVLEESETPEIGGVALPKLTEALMDSQSLAIDTISGCTVTSNAFIEAATAALGLSGADMSLLQQKVDTGDGGPKDVVPLSTDVLVVGAGGAGLTAAVRAAQGGADVLIVEKMSFAGGATAMAGGGTVATGSAAQIAAGIEDSPEWLYEDIMANGHNEADPDTLRLFAETAGAAFDWLVSEDGAAVPYALDRVPSPSAEHRAGRSFSAVGGGGGAVNSLLGTAEALGVTVMYETPATELIVTEGKVTGAMALGADGTPYEITAKSVILATGGYGANPDYLSPEILALPYAGAVSATGDGLKMAMDIGAEGFKLDLVNIQPHSIRLPDGRGQHTYQGCLAMYNGTGSILVSDAGVRFVNERGSANDILAGMRRHDRSFLIMDAASFETYSTTCINSNNYTQAQLDTWLAANGTMDPVFASADTLEELAAIVSMPGDALKASVDTYNASVAAGTDAEFGRAVTEPMSDEGPYYLVEMNQRYYATLGGLHIDSDMRVLAEDGSPIEGLYAAGEVVGGVLGDIYIPGGLFGWAMTSGHNAGLSAVS